METTRECLLSQYENENKDTILKNVINYLPSAHPSAAEIIGN